MTLLTSLTALLVLVDVRLGLADHGLAGSAMEPHTDEVRHRARGDEQRRPFAERLGQAVLEFDHRGVFAPDVAAHSGRGHGGRIAGVGRVTVLLRKSFGVGGMEIQWLGRVQHHRSTRNL